MSKKKIFLKVILWIFLFFLMAVIFCFSHQNGNASGNSSGGLVFKLTQVLPKIIKDAICLVLGERGIEIIVRKSAHLFLFALLGMTSFGLFILYFPQKLKSSFFYSLLYCFLYAASDEIHQYFIPDRAGLFTDVLIDSSGALFGIIIIYFTVKFYRNRKKLKF